MRYYTVSDNRRLVKGTLISLGIHLLVFIILTVVAAVNGVQSRDRLGMITLNLESSSRPARRQAQETVKPEEKAPQPSPSVTPKPEPKKPEPRPVASTKPAQTRPAAVKPTANTTTAKATPEPKTEPVLVKPSAPPSKLETGSLSQLDAGITESETNKASPAKGGGGDKGGGSSGNSSTTTKWDDNAVRELIYQESPLIPDWVRKEGKKLKVELDVELNADGLITKCTIRVSSGHTDVDANVKKAVSRWKYTRGTGAQTVNGVITYFITPR
jgi:TonB family protein